MVTTKELAQTLNLTPRRVQQLTREGILPNESRGKYNLDKAFDSYLKYIDRKSVSTEIKEEKVKYIKAQRELIQTRIDNYKKNYVRVEEALKEAIECRDISMKVISKGFKNFLREIKPKIDKSNYNLVNKIVNDTIKIIEEAHSISISRFQK